VNFHKSLSYRNPESLSYREPEEKSKREKRVSRNSAKCENTQHRRTRFAHTPRHRTEAHSSAHTSISMRTTSYTSVRSRLVARSRVRFDFASHFSLERDKWKVIFFSHANSLFNPENFLNLAGGHVIRGRKERRIQSGRPRSRRTSQ